MLSRAIDAMTGSLVAATDIARNVAETESSLRTRLEAVLARMSDGLLVLDRRGVVDTVNPACCRVLGLNAPLIIGRPLAEVLPPAAALLAGAEESAAGAGAEAGAEADGLVTRVDGRLVPVSVAASPLPAGGFVVLVRDRTRERQVEQMKTEFLANVSHELRTPLTPIRGYSDILSRRPDLGPEKVRQFAEVMADSSLRLNRVVNLLVDVAALDAGRVESEPVPTAPEEFVHARLEAARAAAGPRAGDLRRRVGAGLPRVVVDPVLLGKAFDELVANALKFSDPGSPVVLGAAAGATGGVSFYVRDAGPGMDTDGLAAFYIDFVQADGSATRPREGMGLGLGYVRRVVGALQLKLHVESAVGQGTTVAIEVPGSAALVPPRRTARPKARLPV